MKKSFLIGFAFLMGAVTAFGAGASAPKPAIGGPFPLLCTPYTDNGQVDYEVLAEETKYVADQGVSGIIWPAAKDALKVLTMEEVRQGWLTMGAELKGRGIYLCCCCPGVDTADSLRRIALAEEIAETYPTVPVTMLVRMCDSIKTEKGNETFYEKVAAAAKRPVIIQTFNGKSPAPSAKLLIELAKRHPDRFGYVKDEGSAQKINDHMAELTADPAIRTVFSGWGGRDWLYQYRRIGTRGVISQRPHYASLMVRLWKALESGDPAAEDLAAKWNYLRNLDDFLPSADMRGCNLYVLKRLGIFRNLVSRRPKDEKEGKGWTLHVTELKPREIEELEARIRFAGIVGVERKPSVRPLADEGADTTPDWKPIGKRKVRVVLWGVSHNHAPGKLDSLKLLKDDYEILGFVSDEASKTMRMHEPGMKKFRQYPELTPEQVLNEIRPDVIVVEVCNGDLVEVATRIAKAGIPMHMDKPLGVELSGFRRISDICRKHDIPLQIGYMFRANEGIQFACKAAHDGLIGKIFSIRADLNHSYGGKKYPEYCSAYPGGTAYLLGCHVVEYVMPIFDDAMPTKVTNFIMPAPGDSAGTPSHTLNVVEWPGVTCCIEVCSKGSQPRRALRIDGSDGMIELEPIEDFTKVKHDVGDAAKVDTDHNMKVNVYLKKPAKDKKKGKKAKKDEKEEKTEEPPFTREYAGRTFKSGMNVVDFGLFKDRYAGQLAELAQILRGEKENPRWLYEHDLKVHKVSLQLCNIPVD